MLALLFLLGASWLSACARCIDCPATPYGAEVGVFTPPGTTVTDLQATMVGPVTETLVCQPVTAFLRCVWPPGVAVVPGSYSLKVSAAGYPTMTTQIEVAAEPRDMCGCLQDVFTPSSVMFGRADAGTD